jgi:hypothetical protein
MRCPTTRWPRRWATRCSPISPAWPAASTSSAPVAAAGRNAPRRIAIHADEFNELIGDEFIPLLNKAGGAGFQVTAYTQTWSDVEARIGSPAKAGQIAGNFNTLIMLRVKEVATAELLTSQLPEVHVVSTVVSSSVSDTNDPVDFADFASRNEDRIAPETVRMLEPTDLVQLPKGEAFALIHGGQLHKIRMPLPSASSDPLMPDEPRGDRGDAARAPRRALESAGGRFRTGGSACRLGMRPFTTARWRVCC